MTFRPVFFKTTLARDLSEGGSETEIFLNSLTALDDHVLAMADVGDILFMVINPRGDNREVISVTGLDASEVKGTGLTRGYNFYSIGTIASRKKRHSAGEIVIITNDDHFLSTQYVDVDSAQSIGGIKTFSVSPIVPTPTLAGHAANKEYVDTIAVSGAPDASFTVKGLVEEAQDSDLQLGVATGGTSARLFAGGASFKQTPTANKVPVSNGSGKLEAGWGGAALSLATLNASTKVVEAPADAVLAPAASKIPLADSNGKIAPGWIKNSFGGTGLDGALAITSGTTTIDVGGAAYYEKNYTSISITGTGKLAFTNPAAGGTIVVLKSQGNVTLTSITTPMLDFSGMGAQKGSTPNSLETSTRAGGDGASGPTSNGTAGGTAGPQWTTTNPMYLTSADYLFRRFMGIFCGWAGGDGGNGSVIGGSGGTVGVKGLGGRGGGAAIIECAGAWNFTTANGISVAGSDGTAATDATGGSQVCVGASGGGGGGGGMFLALYNSLTSNAGSVNVSTGRGGAGGAAVSHTTGSATAGASGGASGGGYGSAGSQGASSSVNTGAVGGGGAGSSGGGFDGTSADYAGGAQGSATTGSGISLVTQNLVFP